MTRLERFRRISINPEATFFKPQGIPMKFLEQVDLTLDELEAMRLKNYEGLNMIKGAKKMKISKSTFQRLLSSAHKKVTDMGNHKVIDFNFPS